MFAVVGTGGFVAAGAALLARRVSQGVRRVDSTDTRTPLTEYCRDLLSIPLSLLVPSAMQDLQLPGDVGPGAGGRQQARRVQPLEKSSSSSQNAVQPPPRAESVDEME